VRKKLAPETRSLLAAIKGKMAHKGAESEQIVAAFKKQHPEVLAREMPDLLDMALMKIAGQVGSRRPAGATSAQLELFTEYAIPPTLLIHTADGRRLHKSVLGMTPSACRDHISEQTKPRVRRVSAEVKELVRLLDDVEPYKKSESSTIGECWIAYRDSK
jgi:hypothetical protein